MNEMKIGCCVRPEDIRYIAEIGYDFTELSGATVAAMSSRDFPDLMNSVDQAGIPCLRLNAALTPNIKICGDGYDRNTVEEYAKTLCCRAQKLGVKKIGIGSPNSRADILRFSEELAWLQAKEFLKVFSFVGEKYGISILWETLNPEETYFGISTLQSAKQLVCPLIEGNISSGLVADIYHMNKNNEGIDVLRQVIDYVEHIHIAGNSVQSRGFPDEQFFLNHYMMFDLINRKKNLLVSVEAFQGDLYTDAEKTLTAYRNACRRFGWE